MFILLISCKASDTNISNISPKEALKLIGKDGNILLDVRTKEEYDEGHIPGSVLMPLDIIKNNIEDKIKDKNSRIIVYCRSGNRSANALNILKSLGYKNIYDLGGIISWPYDIEK